jgi:hypothetical protein
MFYATDLNQHGLPHGPFKALVASRPIHADITGDHRDHRWRRLQNAHNRRSVVPGTDLMSIGETACEPINEL